MTSAPSAISRWASVIADARFRSTDELLRVGVRVRLGFGLAMYCYDIVHTRWLTGGRSQALVVSSTHSLIADPSVDSVRRRVRSARALGGGGRGSTGRAAGALLLPSVSPPLRRHQGLCAHSSVCSISFMTTSLIIMYCFCRRYRLFRDVINACALVFPSVSPPF